MGVILSHALQSWAQAHRAPRLRTLAQGASSSSAVDGPLER